MSPQGRDETLDAHGLLTRPADTGRNRPQDFRGQSERPYQLALLALGSIARNGAQMTHNPEGSRLPRRLRGLPTRQSSLRMGLTLWASWQPSPPEIGRHPLAHPTLVLSANPKSLPPAGPHEPDVTLTFTSRCCGSSTPRSARHRGCTGRQSCDGHSGHGRLAGVRWPSALVHAG